MTDLEPQILLLDKPAGVTSHDLVAWWRRELRPLTEERLKIGHAGTLDPLASGLLIMLVGRATRAQAAFLQSMKKYECVIQLGATTDTGDSQGQILTKSAVPPLTPVVIKRALAGLTGKIVLPVPAYAAAKVAGRKLYEYARRNETPPWQPIRVCRLTELELLAYDRDAHQISLGLTCSAGTYVRSLAERLAERLGTVGHLTALRRLASGDFTVADAWPLSIELLRPAGQRSRETETQDRAVG